MQQPSHRGCQWARLQRTLHVNRCRRTSGGRRQQESSRSQRSVSQRSSAQRSSGRAGQALAKAEIKKASRLGKAGLGTGQTSMYAYVQRLPAAGATVAETPAGYVTEQPPMSGQAQPLMRPAQSDQLAGPAVAAARGAAAPAHQAAVQAVQLAGVEQQAAQQREQLGHQGPMPHHTAIKISSGHGEPERKRQRRSEAERLQPFSWDRQVGLPGLHGTIDGVTRASCAQPNTRCGWHAIVAEQAGNVPLSPCCLSSGPASRHACVPAPGGYAVLAAALGGRKACLSYLSAADRSITHSTRTRSGPAPAGGPPRQAHRRSLIHGFACLLAGAAAPL